MHIHVYDVFYWLHSIGYLKLYIGYLFFMDMINAQKMELIQKSTYFCFVGFGSFELLVLNTCVRVSSLKPGIYLNNI
jgi:hypothetical protein